MFKTDRIYLKEINPSDLTDEVMAWFSDKELMKFYTNSTKPITRDELISSIENGKKNGNLINYGIFDLENDTLIGTIKLGPINFSHKTSDLVALIGNRNYLGKGLSVDAISLGNRLAFEKYDIRKLYGGMYQSNIPSIKGYTRAGWIIEGRLKSQFLVNGKSEDRILVGCYNPKYFSQNFIEAIKENEHRYI